MAAMRSAFVQRYEQKATFQHNLRFACLDPRGNYAASAVASVMRILCIYGW